MKQTKKAILSNMLLTLRFVARFVQKRVCSKCIRIFMRNLENGD
jgi:hypothetical protein